MLGSAKTNLPLLTLTSWVKGTSPFHIFANFRVSMEKKNVGGMCALKFDATDLPHLNRHTPSFSGQVWSWPGGVNHLPSRAFQSQVTQIRVHQKEAILRCFILHKVDFPGQTVNCCLQCTIHILKAIVPVFFWHIWGPSACILWPARFVCNILGINWQY